MSAHWCVFVFDVRFRSRFNLLFVVRQAHTIVECLETHAISCPHYSVHTTCGGVVKTELMSDCNLLLGVSGFSCSRSTVYCFYGRWTVRDKKKRCIREPRWETYGFHRHSNRIIFFFFKRFLTLFWKIIAQIFNSDFHGEHVNVKFIGNTLQRIISLRFCRSNRYGSRTLKSLAALCASINCNVWFSSVISDTNNIYIYIYI